MPYDVDPVAGFGFFLAYLALSLPLAGILKICGVNDAFQKAGTVVMGCGVVVCAVGGCVALVWSLFFT